MLQAYFSRICFRLISTSGIFLSDFHPINGRLDPYDGEIRLCPPDSVVNDLNGNISSVSFGVVALYLSNIREWTGVIQLRAINSSNKYNGLLDNNAANAICQQLGYTDAIVGSAIARSATGYTFDRC